MHSLTVSVNFHSSRDEISRVIGPTHTSALDPRPVLKQSASFIGSFLHILLKAFGSLHKINTHSVCTVVIYFQCQLIYYIKRDNLSLIYWNVF